MPNSLQYPLERERELQHRWKRLLQRTMASKDNSAAYLSASRSAARFGGKLIADETDKWGNVIRAANIKAE